MLLSIGGKFSLTKMQVVALFQDSHVEVLSAMVANMVYIIDALARYRFMVLSVANMVYIIDALAR